MEDNLNSSVESKKSPLKSGFEIIVCIVKALVVLTTAMIAFGAFDDMWLCWCIFGLYIIVIVNEIKKEVAS
jgi:hypothetical protein